MKLNGQASIFFDRKAGFSLIGIIISIAIMVPVVSALSQTFFTVNTAQRKSILLGEKEDIRHWVIEAVSCSQTIVIEKAGCDAQALISARTASGAKVINDKNAGHDFGDINLKLDCKTKNGYYEINGTYTTPNPKNPSVPTTQRLFEIPITCK